MTHGAHLDLSHSLGISLRGEYNVVRYNSVVEAAGACIRVGGNEVDGRVYGKYNEVRRGWGANK